MGVDFLDVVLDSAGAHPLGIHGKDEFLEAADIILALLDDSRRKFGFPVPGTYRDSMPWWPEPVTPPKGSPNIVFVVLDDVGFSDLGCYGSEIATPHIDALAGSGLHYSNFHVTAMCSPTRACLLTGRNAHAVGMGAIAEWSCGFPGYEGKITHRAATLAEILKGAGVGKWHLAPLEAMNAAGPMDQWPRGVGSNAGSVFMVPWGTSGILPMRARSLSLQAGLRSRCRGPGKTRQATGRRACGARPGRLGRGLQGSRRAAVYRRRRRNLRRGGHGPAGQGLAHRPADCPGVPWIVSIDEAPLALALKSGNFGGTNFFADALDMLPWQRGDWK